MWLFPHILMDFLSTLSPLTAGRWEKTTLINLHTHKVITLRSQVREGGNSHSNTRPP